MPSTLIMEQMPSHFVCVCRRVRAHVGDQKRQYGQFKMSKVHLQIFSCSAKKAVVGVLSDHFLPLACSMCVEVPLTVTCLHFRPLITLSWHTKDTDTPTTHDVMVRLDPMVGQFWPGGHKFDSNSNRLLVKTQRFSLQVLNSLRYNVQVNVMFVTTASTLTHKK